MDKNCLMTAIVVIIALVLLLWMFHPYMNANMVFSERFSETVAKPQYNHPSEEAQFKERVYPNKAPTEYPTTGTIMDGPGFERGTMEVSQGQTSTEIPSNYYFLDDGANGEFSIQNNLCSKSCCSSQWPVPFALKYDPTVCQNSNEYVGSNIMCNNSFQDSGCACLTKKQANFIYNRGTNGREWF